MQRSIDWILAIAGGLLLALMIDSNSLLAKQSTPLLASWIAHVIGAFVALFFIMIYLIMSKKAFWQIDKRTVSKVKKPFWVYLGGIPGALTVVLASITVNSSLGLSGALALMLVGQIIFGLVADILGLLGTTKRKLGFIDFFVILFVLSGSLIIIFFRS